MSSPCLPLPSRWIHYPGTKTDFDRIPPRYNPRTEALPTCETSVSDCPDVAPRWDHQPYRSWTTTGSACSTPFASWRFACARRNRLRRLEWQWQFWYLASGTCATFGWCTLLYARRLGWLTRDRWGNWDRGTLRGRRQSNTSSRNRKSTY